MRFLFFLTFILFLGCIQGEPASPAITEEIPAQPSESMQEPAVAGEVPETSEVTEMPSETVPAQPLETPFEKASVKSDEITYDSSSWKIRGTMYPARQASPTKVIVLVPTLGESRNSYPSRFIERLHDEFPEAIVVSIDPRGQGESTNLGNWETFGIFDFKNMKLDITDLQKYIDPKAPTAKEYYVIGSSIGSSSAVNAASQMKSINKIVMISPGDYHEVDISRAVDSYVKPLLVVVGDDDRYSYQKALELNLPNTKIYRGVSAHGTDLFDATKNDPEPLEEAIIKFLK